MSGKYGPNENSVMTWERFISGMAQSIQASDVTKKTYCRGVHGQNSNIRARAS